MARFVLCFVSFYSLGALLAWMTWGSSDFRDRTEFAIGGIGATIVGYSIAIWCTATSDFPLTGVIFAPGACFYTWFLAHAIGHLVIEGKKSAMGDTTLQVAPTYHQAEAAEKRHDFAAAERLYRQAIAERPDDAEAKRRLAELHLLRGDAEAAARAYRALIADTPDPEGASLLVFRLADLLSGTLGRRDEALSLLREFEKRHPQSGPAVYARERAARLGE
ncbi:MAG: tetratricopeptide repeat protein [Planctomycetes bacterium]|nr:tetratricopeptide repeat protein [Planctomycetota bacterium]